MSVLDKAREAVIELKRLEEIKAGMPEASGAQELIGERLKENQRVINSAIEIIDAVENVNERSVLQYRYLLAYTWQDTATAVGCDMSTVFRRHNRALRKLGMR